MTIQEALAWGRLALAASPSPGLDARLLLAHVLGVSHAYLVGHSQDTLPAAQQAAYAALVARAQRHEPIPYLVGHAPFYGLDFLVSPAVLIPRPETEQLVEQALAWANSHRPGRIVDVGTGSGCIAITLARHLPQAEIIAIDLSSEALAIAQENGARHAPGRVQFRHGSLLAPINTPADLIIANLPYVTDAEWTLLDDGVKWYEPATALRGGPDGLVLVQQLLHQAAAKLRPGGAIFLEIGWQQGSAAQQLAAGSFPAGHIQCRPDFAGHDRFIIIQTGD